MPRKNFGLKKGRVCYNIYFVKKGLIRCFYTKEQDVIFSIESFLDQIPSRENIQTVEDSRCCMHITEISNMDARQQQGKRVLVKLQIVPGFVEYSAFNKSSLWEN